MRPGTRSTGFGSPRQRAGSRASTTTSSAVRAASSSPVDRVVRALGRHERAGSTVLLAAAQRAVPSREVEHGAVVVAEVAQEPPQPLGAAERAVRDHECAVADAGPAAAAANCSARRQRMAPAASPAARGRARRRGTPRPGCAPRGRRAARSSDRRATSGSRRSGSARVTGNQSGGVGPA